ncbi:MAG: hypothetical protein R2830_22490 [Saprospiraceae bacterium]
MSSYKLYRLIGLLGSDEIPVVSRFLESPAHNSDKECSRFFRELVKFHPSMEHPKLTNERLFKRLYGPLPYDDQKLRRLRMKLKVLLERYLAVAEIDLGPDLSQKALVQSLARRSDYGLFCEAVKDRMEALDNQPYRGKAYHFEMAHLWKELHYHPETNFFNPDNDYLQQHIRHLETYFALATLQSGAEGLLLQRIVSSSEESRLMEPIANLSANGQPVVQLFQLMYHLFSQPGLSISLHDLSGQLHRCLPLLAPDEQRFALKMGIHYATPFSNSGSREHSRFMFGLYKTSVERGLLDFAHSLVSPDLFTNIVITAALVGEFDWATAFMQDHGPLLPEKDRHDARCLCEASIRYQQGIATGDTSFLKDALRQLALISVRSNEKYNLRMRSLQLRIHFDLFLHKEEGYDNVLELARYFENHLHNHPHYSDEKREAYLRFVNHVKALFKLASNPDADGSGLDLYLKELSSSPRPILQHWLLEKAGELRQSPHLH